MSTAALTNTRTLTASEVTEEFWGAAEITADRVQTTDWIFWHSELFRVALEFQYTIGGGRSGEASYEFECVPVAPGLTGRYNLYAINDIPLPAPSFGWDTVHAASFEFFAHDLTYTTSSKVSKIGLWDTPQEMSTGPDGYDVLRAGSFFVPEIVFGTPGGEVVLRSGTTLLFREQCWCGLPDLVWRYDLAVTGALSDISGRRASPAGVEISVPGRTGGLPRTGQSELRRRDVPRPGRSRAELHRPHRHRG